MPEQISLQTSRPVPSLGAPSSNERKGGSGVSDPPTNQPQKKQTGGEALSIKNPILKYLVDFSYTPDDALDTVNRIGNLIGAVPNIFGAIFSALGIFQPSEETSEKIYGTASKISTITRGVTGAIDNIKKGNPIPFIGSILEIPTALTSSGFLLWLRRGIPQSIRQLQSALKYRVINVTTTDGKKVETTGEHWGSLNLGFKERVRASLSEIGLIFKEIFTDPFGKDPNKTPEENKIIRNSKSMMGCSSLQFLGPIIAMASEKAGAFVRDLGGALVDFVYLGDKNPNYRNGGKFWIGSAVFDFAKRFTENERLKGFAHHLSVFLDPIAAIFESRGNFDEKNKVKSPESDEKEISPSSSVIPALAGT